MTQKVVGTLREFIEIELNQTPSSSTLKNLPFHKKGNTYRKRTKTSIDDYVATKKKMQKKSILTNSQIQHKSDLFIQYKSQQRDNFQKIVEKRQKRSIHNISLFKKDAYFAEYHIKARPKLEESMLRAVQKIRYIEQDESITKNKHQVSFDNRQHFSRIKLAPFMFDPSKKNRQYVFGNQFLKKSTERKNNGKMSSEKRIEYEQCLNWAKKHHKDSHYYQIQLGKLKTTQSLQEKSERRKKMLSKIKQKQNAKSKRQKSLH